MKNISVETIVKKNIERVWEFWTEPKHITHWAFASDTWECPYAENDLKVYGRFLTRMSDKKGTTTFDFTGTYTNIVPLERIEYRIDGGRMVSIEFKKLGDTETKVTEEFEMEGENSEELQQAGWQAILDNFKKYAEATD